MALAQHALAAIAAAPFSAVTDVFRCNDTEYDALIRLTATLCKIFPQIKCDYPRDDKGQLIPGVLSQEKLDSYQGLIGHYHIQKNKTDPGPAFDWSRIVEGARAKMKP